MMQVQSFGGGVQSVALLRMAIAGHIEKPDLVVFADTGAEPQHVYEVIEREAEVCAVAGIEFAKLCFGDLTKWRENGSIHVPLRTELIGGKEQGLLFRTCTDRFKIQPIRRELRARGVTSAVLWLGMSVDEIQRVKPSNVGWITNRHPLIEMGLRRHECETFLASIGVSTSKSACVFCPYRSTGSWRTVRDNPTDWAAALAYDESIRDARPGYKCFVHKSYKPLTEAVLENDDPGLFDDECDGVCAS